MLVIAWVGFHCAIYLTSKNPLWVRLIVLLPALVALATIVGLLRHNYYPDWYSVAQAISILAMYAVIASRFGDRGHWLDIETGE
jgi:hypothetical protein